VLVKVSPIIVAEVSISVIVDTFSRKYWYQQKVLVLTEVIIFASTRVVNRPDQL